MASGNRIASAASATTNPRSGGAVTTTEAGPSVPINTTQATLRLRAPSEQRRIQWAEDVVDNEGMGKKSSKVCCIYHKPREAGDSSSEDDSSTSSDGSDGEPDLSRAQPTNQHSGSGSRDHGHGDDAEDPDNDAPGNGPKKPKAKSRNSRPNAYERVSKLKGRKL